MSEIHLVAGTTKARIQFLLNDLALYGLSSALVPLMGLVAVPILTRNLTTAEYGAFELVLSYIGVAVIIGGAGQDSAFARYYYDDTDMERRSAVIRNVLWNQGACALAMVLIFVIAGASLFRDISEIPYFSALVLVAACAVPSVVALNFVRNQMKWTFRRKQYIVSSLVYSACVLLGYYWLVVVLRKGVLGAVLSQAIAAMIVGVGGGWTNRALFSSIGKRFSLPLLQYGAPYVALGVISQGFRALDKTILVGANGLESAAAYAVGFKIATIVLIIEATFHLALGPIVIAIHKESDAQDTYNVSLRLLAWTLSGVFLCVTYLSGWVVSLVAPGNYEAAPTVAAIICLGFVVQSLAGITAIGIELAKKPRLLLLSWGVGAGLAVLLMLALAPRMGALGVAFAFTFGLAVESIVRTKLAYDVFPVRFQLGKGLLPLVVALTMAGASVLANQSYLLPTKALCLACFGALALLALARDWRSVS